MGGFTYAIAISLWTGTTRFDWMIFFTPIVMVAGGILGVIKGTIVWVIYRLSGMRMGAFARVAISSIGAFLLVIFLSFQFGANNEDVAIWLTMTLSVGVPTALLVGSNVNLLKPFTFAPANNHKPLTILPEHQCLGTRFVEWQKHVA